MWFDDSDAEAKLVEFLDRREQADHDSSASPATPLSRDTSSFLDLGCGNGSLLFALHAEGWRGHMRGVDYSPQSVELSKRIAASLTDESSGDCDIDFLQWNIIAGKPQDICTANEKDGWDVVLDKGTFDAISLNSERDVEGKIACEKYKSRILPLVKDGGIFLLTSCNWTEQELLDWFVEDQSSDPSPLGRFIMDGKVAYRSFRFGGQQGQTISSICFRKVVTAT